MVDVVAQMGPSFLGSRLKRLGERMQASASAIIAQAGLPLQPGHMAIMAALRIGPKTVGQLAEAGGTSQPGVTRALAQLYKLGMVADEPSDDQRCRMVGLTPAGFATVQTIATDVWPRVGMAAEEILALLDGDFLRQLAIIEKALAQSSIAERAARAVPGALTLRAFDDTLAADFHDINAEWIEAMFSLEQVDRDILENPRERVIDPGGSILFVEASGFGIVGTCALQKAGPGAFELTKMGVRETARGLKVGEFLLEAMIAEAQDIGARKLFLLTNRKCAPAIHLYEKLGFVHDAGIMAEYGARYERCDVAMLYAGA
ncbi:bifunctional helix-turn-helix transcriptional regulator/GNAT family N-acetyltransferase [Qipengyuania zhejiangensis]|uniref:bifunctional helix-turn-helix transcriptional regulator/GNAT family N-acetyltransferase n=1 Tax=Qipengyuania zhejiangensis TaxID=3077782 RepID=UPI002D7964E2|nr:bifunctional helix-turn-helix transcriptional regulator/GNAT family N-acetyltransferase [Qipengyuania sp. Z2]